MKAAVAAMMLAAGVVGLWVAEAATAPKPSDVPVSWELDFSPHKGLQSLQVRLSEKEPPRTFWYLIYTVTNKTGQDQVFAPEFLLYTDTGQAIPAGKTPFAVFEVIKRLHNDPLMQEVTGTTGKLLQGDDNAKTGVAIWPDFDSAAGAVDVFINGLSGETAEIALPSPVEVVELDPRTGKTHTITRDRIVLSKTLQLRYSVPGEAGGRARTSVKLEKKAWVMR